MADSCYINQTNLQSVRQTVNICHPIQLWLIGPILLLGTMILLIVTLPRRSPLKGETNILHELPVCSVQTLLQEREELFP